MDRTERNADAWADRMDEAQDALRRVTPEHGASTGPTPRVRDADRVIPHTWHCDTCPFGTSDPRAKVGHETYLDSHPRGWLGYGESHSMRAAE